MFQYHNFDTTAKEGIPNVFRQLKVYSSEALDAKTVRRFDCWKNERRHHCRWVKVSNWRLSRTKNTFASFVVKSLIALRIRDGDGCILTAVDIQKFFDKQSLADAMHTLYKSNVS